MPALRSVNKVILVGNLTRDPEVNYTAAQTPVCVFTVATNRSWKNAKDEMHEEASYHRVNAWGKFGENLSTILKKGMKVYVEGILTYREQRDATGKLVSKDARIRAESVIILDGRMNRPATDGEFAAAQGENPSTDIDLDSIAQGLEDDANKATPVASTPVATATAPTGDDDLPF